MHSRADVRDWLTQLAHPAAPKFEPSDDPVLGAFAELFLVSGLYAFDANKHLRTDALTTIYDCETESQRDANGAYERFVAVWSPVWVGTDEVTGFRTGHDSVWLGSTPTVAMPQDERTAALLLLVTSDFVHLSGVIHDNRPLVRGAISLNGLDHRFVGLVDEHLTSWPARPLTSVDGRDAT
jgi:hypothetical protein